MQDFLHSTQLATCGLLTLHFLQFFKVCVEKCPDYGEPWSALTALETRQETEEQIKKKLICKYGVDKSSQSVAQLIAYPKHQCASYVLPSKTSE